MSLRKLLFPFSFLYGIVTFIRNKFFDWGILKSTSFNIPVICVGNLSAGGTGKTPLTNYLLRLLLPEFYVAVLSRGYGRSSKGFILADENSNAKQIGDEPLTYYKSFHKNKKMEVAVCENRVNGINILKEKFPELKAVLLDDAFQHRSVKAGLNILLTDYSKLFIHDSMLPSGNLREYKSGANRADIIVVTKCPYPISTEIKNEIKLELKIKPHQHLFFSFMKYGDLINVSDDTVLTLGRIKNYEIILLTGIAQPQSLKLFLEKNCKKLQHIEFNDHHYFTVADVLKAKQLFDIIATPQKIIVTTGKDYARLMSSELQQHISKLPVFIQSVEFDFDVHEKQHFNKLITNYVRKN